MAYFVLTYRTKEKKTKVRVIHEDDFTGKEDACFPHTITSLIRIDEADSKNAALAQALERFSGYSSAQEEKLRAAFRKVWTLAVAPNSYTEPQRQAILTDSRALFDWGE